MIIRVKKMNLSLNCTYHKRTTKKPKKVQWSTGPEYGYLVLNNTVDINTHTHTHVSIGVN